MLTDDTQHLVISVAHLLVSATLAVLSHYGLGDRNSILAVITCH